MTENVTGFWEANAKFPNEMYPSSELSGRLQSTFGMWEKWIDLLEDIRDARNAEGRELFINATNGAILSPWILQWVNTVWLNTGGDTGELGTGERHQQKIYYRDQVYYNQFANQRQIQFPLGHLYNHDPIYAASDGSDASPEVFREYLFANAMRGTAFWEVYFSPSIMDDAHWQIAADVLKWAEDNHEVLKNAHYFGNDPSEGVYGYSCFKGNQGIISFTNPLHVEQTYTMKGDGILGADKSLNGAKGFQVLPCEEKDLGALTYGDMITVKPKPHQTIIQQYGMVDTQAPAIAFVRSEGNDKIIVKFSERIYLDSAAIEGMQSTASLQEDYRTVALQTKESLTGKKQVNVRVREMSGNVYETCVEAICYGKDNIIVHVAESDNMKDAENICVTYDEAAGMAWMDGVNQRYEVLTDNELAGSGAFTISTGVQTEASDMNLVTSGNDVKLAVDENGYVQFTVGDVKLCLQETETIVTEKAFGTIGTVFFIPAQTETIVVGRVNDGKTHAITAVRETNGMLKLYLDGELCASGYDEVTAFGGEQNINLQ